MRKYTARMLFRDFRAAYPELWRYGSIYRLVGFMKIEVKIPTVGVLEYEYFGNKITWLKHWEDPKQIKQNERDNRKKYYTYFVFLLEELMDYENLTQQDIANMCGVSRRSINEYLSGKSIPKVSTMRMICDKLGIEDFD